MYVLPTLMLLLMMMMMVLMLLAVVVVLQVVVDAVVPTNKLTQHMCLTPLHVPMTAVRVRSRGNSDKFARSITLPG